MDEHHSDLHHKVTLRYMVDEACVEQIQQRIRSCLAQVPGCFDSMVAAHKDDWRLQPLESGQRFGLANPIYVTCRFDVPSRDAEHLIENVRQTIAGELGAFQPVVSYDPLVQVNPFTIPFLPSTPVGREANTREIVRRHPPYVR